MSNAVDDSVEETAKELKEPTPSSLAEKTELATALLKVVPGLVPDSIKKLDSGLSTGIEGLLNVMNFRGLSVWNERRRLIAKRNMRALADEFAKKDDDDLALAPMEMEQPILEKLTFTSDEKLSEILIKLLSAAASKSRSDLAHPAMITVAENLSPDEAIILNSFTDAKFRIPMIGVSFVDKRPEMKNATSVAAKYYSQLKDLDLANPQKIDFYIGNLISHGLFETTLGFVPIKDATGSNQPHPLYAQLVNEASQQFKPPYGDGNWNFKTARYYFSATDKGQMFISILNRVDVSIG